MLYEDSLSIMPRLVSANLAEIVPSILSGEAGSNLTRTITWVQLSPIGYSFFLASYGIASSRIKSW